MQIPPPLPLPSTASRSAPSAAAAGPAHPINIVTPHCSPSGSLPLSERCCCCNTSTLTDARNETDSKDKGEGASVRAPLSWPLPLRLCPPAKILSKPSARSPLPSQPRPQHCPFPSLPCVQSQTGAPATTHERHSRALHRAESESRVRLRGPAQSLAWPAFPRSPPLPPPPAHSGQPCRVHALVPV
jgi:hypothetical protein